MLHLLASNQQTMLCFQDPKLRESLNIGQKDVPLEDKTVSVSWGPDMVNVDWINFVCADRETAKVRS